MYTTNTRLDLTSVAMGILMTSIQYKEDHICVWAPKEHSIILDYLTSAFGGRIIKATGKRTKWIIDGRDMNSLVDFISREMPQCESRSKFHHWAKDRYTL